MNKPLTAKQATKQGFRPLTFPYEICEEHLMAGVISDLDQGGISHVIVEKKEGKEIWRK